MNFNLPALPAETMQAIVAALNEKAIIKDCVACEKPLGIFEGHFSPEAILADGRRIRFRCIALVCDSCGFTQFHSTDVLGLSGFFPQS